MVTYCTSKCPMQMRNDHQASRITTGYKNNECIPNMKTDHAEYQNTCQKVAYQRAIVNVPIAVKPFSSVGPVNTFCCNDAKIENMYCKPHGNKQICCFVISQEICVEIPVHFGAYACAGESWIDCKESSADLCGDFDTETR